MKGHTSTRRDKVMDDDLQIRQVDLSLAVVLIFMRHFG